MSVKVALPSGKRSDGGAQRNETYLALKRELDEFISRGPTVSARIFHQRFPLARLGRTRARRASSPIRPSPSRVDIIFLLGRPATISRRSGLARRRAAPRRAAAALSKSCYLGKETRLLGEAKDTRADLAPADLPSPSAIPPPRSTTARRRCTTPRKKATTSSSKPSSRSARTSTRSTPRARPR